VFRHSDLSCEQTVEEQQPKIGDLVEIVWGNGPGSARVALHFDDDVLPRDHELLVAEIFRQVRIAIQDRNDAAHSFPPQVDRDVG